MTLRYTCYSINIKHWSVLVHISPMVNFISFPSLPPALTPANLLAAVEGLEEGRWRRLGIWLGVPSAKRDEIESQHRHLSDRLREIFSYFLRLDPDASWRRVLNALDCMGETKLADSLRQLAEPVTGMWLCTVRVSSQHAGMLSHLVCHAAVPCNEMKCS